MGDPGKSPANAPSWDEVKFWVALFSWLHRPNRGTA